MIRSASLKDNANLVKYIPDFVEKIKFEDTANELGIAGITEQENTKHLKLFYLIIPALTLIFVDHIQ